jgi:hypothetical protein
MDQLDLWGAPKRALPKGNNRGLTVDAARERLETAMVDGAVCPCCESWVQRYRRTLTAGMAVVLCRIVRQTVGRQDPWVKVYEMKHPPLGGDFAKLRHWKLLERLPKDWEDTTRRTSGVWRATDKGIDFALGRIMVPRAYFDYQGRCLGFDEELTTIQQALGKRFDYGELMSGVPR